jgi:hypothetical protein
MHTKSLAASICLTIGIALLSFHAQAGSDSIKVYKSPTCGCCSKWIDHLRANGFEVEAVEIKSVQPVKISNGVTPELASCHTALVGGYVVEGHVPACRVRRLLEERSKIN